MQRRSKPLQEIGFKETKRWYLLIVLEFIFVSLRCDFSNTSKLCCIWIFDFCHFVWINTDLQCVYHKFWKRNVCVHHTKNINRHTSPNADNGKWREKKPTNTNLFDWNRFKLRLYGITMLAKRYRAFKWSARLTLQRHDAANESVEKKNHFKHTKIHK